jgi:thiol-disulfide isomerase/thioredoxin
MKNLFFFTAILAILFFNNCFAQIMLKDSTTAPTSDVTSLKDLKKAGDNDIDHSKPLMLDGVSIPIFTEDGIKVKAEELMTVMTSGEYGIDPYIDKDKNVKAFVLHKLTDEEKKSFGVMMQQNMEENDLTGKDAIPFSATDINGKNFSLNELKGKIIVINFWFIECKPCKMEIPELNKVVDKYAGKEVVFIAFANNEKSKLQSFLQENEFKYNVISSPEDVLKSYNISAFPTNLVIDKNLKISFCKLGYDPGSVNELDKAIEVLMK